MKQRNLLEYQNAIADVLCVHIGLSLALQVTHDASLKKFVDIIDVAKLEDLKDYLAEQDKNLMDEAARAVAAHRDYNGSRSLLGEGTPLTPKGLAEQYAKALNMANEFRLLSDVPVDGVEQYYINAYGNIDCYDRNNVKLWQALFGVVVNEDRQDELDPWCEKVRIANKILQFGFHGIVEERL